MNPSPGDLGPIIGLTYEERQLLQELARQLPAPTKDIKPDDMEDGE